MNRSRTKLLKALGPGLIFAAAAVGVSHLVQSTRAGASFGLALVGVTLLANLVKYPAFRFGPWYASATNTSLLQGYRRQGMWALSLFAVMTVLTMFTVQAAVTVTTAGLLVAITGVGASPAVVSIALLALAALALRMGRYHWLDRFTKVLMPLLTLSTLVATAVALPRVDWSTAALIPTGALWTPALVAFVAPFVGWMPGPLDISVWQSLWTLARNEEAGTSGDVGAASFDFHVGYVGTTVLALAFMLMGAGVMHGSGQEFEASAAGFAMQVINLYRETLGAWSGPVVGLSAFAVMLSTSVTVLDGFARALAVVAARFRSDEDPNEHEFAQPEHLRVYSMALVALVMGASTVLLWFMSSFKGMIDVATALSVLTAPLLAFLNHRAITSADVPVGLRPGRPMVWASWAAISALSAFAAWYLWYLGTH